MIKLADPYDYLIIITWRIDERQGCIHMQHVCAHTKMQLHPKEIIACEI